MTSTNNSDTIANNEFGSASLISLSESHQAIAITHKNCTAKVSLYGGHVLSWQPNGQKPVLWLSDTASYQPGSAIRGGIPLCWPWFGPHSKGDIKGNHGFARNENWQLEQVTVEAEQVKVVLSFSGEHKHPLWPSKFNIKQELSFGETFEQALHFSNLTDEAVEYTSAIHSYFQVSSPQNCQVESLEQAEFDDKITGLYCQATALNDCIGPLDRIYYTDKISTLVDSQWQRGIEITPINTQQWVLWNPGTDIANNMADVHPGGEHEYVCLEAANTKWQTIPAQQTVTVGQKIRLVKL